MEELTQEENDFFESGGETEVSEEVAEQPQEQPQEQPDTRTVPLAALHEERSMRKELQSEINNLKQQLEGFSGLKSEFEEYKSSLNKEPEVNYEDDPIGAIEYQNKQLQERVEDLDLYRLEQEQRSQEMREYQELVGKYQSAAKSYAQSNPEFDKSYTFLVSSRAKEYEAMGYSQDQVGQLLAQEELQIVQKAFEDGANPAERIYELAKVRGFTNADLETVQKGIESQSNISRASSKPEPSSDIERLLELDGEEFDKAWEKLGASM